MTDYSSETCANCRHWHELARHKIHTPDGPATDMGAVLSGECRHEVRHIVMGGPQGVQVAPMYVQTPSAFPACSNFDRDSLVGRNALLSLVEE